MTSKEYNKMNKALDAVSAIAAPYKDVMEVDIQRTLLKITRLQNELTRLEAKYDKIERQKKQPSA